METNEFDKLLRDRLAEVTEPAPDVWEGIAKGLDRRHRLVVFRRWSVAVTAAAAVLALALLVFRGPRTEGQETAPVQTARVEQPAIQPAPVEEPVEVAPIQEQIKQFTRSQAVAVAKVDKPAQVSAAETVPAEPAEEATPDIPQQAAETQPTAEPTDHRLTEEQLPADFWTKEEPSASRNKSAHTSQISILSNLTTVASDGTLLYKAAPMHASSQTGKGQATSQVEPLATSPKFFAPLTLGLQADFPLTDRLSFGTGVTYSYLVSQYDMLVDKVLYEGAYNQLHYVGVPLRLTYRFVQTDHFGAYAAAGGAAEKCVAQRYVYGSNTLHEKVGGLQWSVGVGVGVEYWFVPRLGIYFDPSLVYFFDNSQPLSIRTQQPLQAKFEVGFRFKI